ncbi:MAG: glycosyltransferase family 2 protein [Prevotella sp.]|nr:glycosyltransferase family 2 protein [Prevotella sp.]
MKRLAIVLPCYNEEAVIKETASRILVLLDGMITRGEVEKNSRILFVDDGSSDQTWPIIEKLHTEFPCIYGLKLAGNTGHQNALLAGLATAKDFSDVLISIDADLQDDICVIPEMVSKFKEGFDIVYGVRRERNTDTFFKRTTAIMFYRLMGRLGVKSVYNHADYRLMSHRAVEQLCHYRERNLFLRGIVPLIGYRSSCIYYDRQERFAGESKYPLRKMMNFAVDGITSFSIRPVRMVFGMGIIFLIISLGIFIYVLHSYLMGSVVPGWASLILSIWFVGGCILLGLGIVGEYIGKTYMEVKDRPRYNIEKLLSDETTYKH